MLGVSFGSASSRALAEATEVAGGIGSSTAGAGSFPRAVSLRRGRSNVGLVFTLLFDSLRRGFAERSRSGESSEVAG